MFLRGSRDTTRVYFLHRLFYSLRNLFFASSLSLDRPLQLFLCGARDVVTRAACSPNYRYHSSPLSHTKARMTFRNRYVLQRFFRMKKCLGLLTVRQVHYVVSKDFGNDPLNGHEGYSRANRFLFLFRPFRCRSHVSVVFVPRSRVVCVSYGYLARFLLRLWASSGDGERYDYDTLSM